jgi:pyruvate dehydrogenase E2 component (dihydrolipoamide acetyltransferase)
MISKISTNPLLGSIIRRHASSVSASPAASHMIRSQGLNEKLIKGTAKHGIISKGDVLHYLATMPAGSSVDIAAINYDSAPVAHAPVTVSTIPSPFTDVPNSNMRKIIAKRLTESKQQVPHLYATVSTEIDALLKFRSVLKKNGINVSVNDLVIKAAALALRDVPEANAKWSAKANARDTSSSSVDISVAVATPSGLITPIVTNADKRGLVDITNTVKDLATRAKDNKLKPEEFQGGSFTISNLGMFGISEFSAVINPPQCCILAVGGGVGKVMPPASPGAQPRVVTTMTVQLSADRRVVDEAIAAQYLQVSPCLVALCCCIAFW